MKKLFALLLSAVAICAPAAALADLPFTTGGAAEWTVETDGTWRSGYLAGAWQESWAEVSVTAPSVVTFKWKVSSRENSHELFCYLDESEIAGPISGIMSEWKEVTIAVSGSGSRVVRFSYKRTVNAPEGENCGWVKDFTVHESHVLTFNANGGTVRTSEKLAGDGLAAGLLPDPIWSGEGNLAFTGWFTAASGGDRVTNDTVVTADMTLYAHWTESPFSATGGGEEVGGGAWAIAADGTWRSGYFADGFRESWAEVSVTGPCVVSFKWKTSAKDQASHLSCFRDGTEIVGSPINGKVSDWNKVTFTVGQAGSHVVKFRYFARVAGDYGSVKDFELSDAETCILTFNANGGEVATGEQLVAVGYSAGALPAPVWTGEGMRVFAGWFTAASGGTKVTSETVVNANMTLYAHWTELPFTTGGDAPWTVDGDGKWKSGTISDDQATWAEVAVTAPCLVSFQWKTSSESNYDNLHCYLITNGSTNEIVSAISGVMSDWADGSVEVNGSGRQTVRFEYTKDGDFLEGDDCGWVKDFTVHEAHVLMFDANGGTVGTSEKLAFDGLAAGELPVPVWTGEGMRVFAGWFTAASGGTRVTSETVVNANMTLYAHWVESSFTTGGDAAWTVDVDGNWKSGAISDKQTTWAEVAVTAPCLVSFQWKTSSERNCDNLHCYLIANGSTNEVVSAISGVMSDWADGSFEVNGSGRQTVRFEYTKDVDSLEGDDCGWIKDFTVHEAHVLTFNANGGTVGTSEKLAFDGLAAGELPVAVWTGEGAWDFVGWFTAASGGDEVTASTVITADMTLYAHWSLVIDLADLTGDFILTDGMIATGTLAGRYKVSIADDAMVTLSNATINLSQTSGSTWAGLTCLGSATIVLEGANAVKSLNEYHPGIYVPQHETLTIQGDGALTATGGQFYGAGIGGGYGSSRSCGGFVIKSGTVDATGGGFAAGIGCGFGSNCDDITISGGNVTAKGGGGCAGIGGSTDTACGNITISGGTVDATGGESAAGIGGGSAFEGMGECGYITISGGTVTATGGANAAGIGTGENGYCYGIIIGKGISRVTATCGDGGVEPIGLGGGEYSECMTESNIDGRLSDVTTGSTRVLEGSGTGSGFSAWAAEKGLTGDDAEWDAKPAKWGGSWANAFVYTYGEGLADGTVTLMVISFDANGKPVITTAPVVEGHTDFTAEVVGSESVGDWASPVTLQQSGDNWTLPAGESANFFRVRLEE